MSRVPAAVAAVLAAATAGAGAQATFRGYALNVAAATGRSGWEPGTVSDLQRLRLMAVIPTGPLGIELADEQAFRYQQRATPVPFGSALGTLRASGDWLSLDGTLASGRHALWRHRVDRFNATLSLGPAALTLLGRQAISWGTTLLLTPADPFVPSDPFREYRAGVDAVRAQWFLGPTSALEVAVRA